MTGRARRLLVGRAPRPALVLSAVVVALNIALVVLAFAAASGVTRVGPTTYDTEFIHPVWMHLSWLTLVLVGAAAARSAPGALVGLFGVVAVHVVAAHRIVARYAETGWGSGLESLAYLFPIGLLVFGLVAVGAGVIIGEAWRERAGATGRR